MNCTVTAYPVVILGYSARFMRVWMDLCFVMYSSSAGMCDIFVLSASFLSSNCAVVVPSVM